MPVQGCTHQRPPSTLSVSITQLRRSMSHALPLPFITRQITPSSALVLNREERTPPDVAEHCESDALPG